MNVDKAALLVGNEESHLTTIVSQLENLKLEVTQTRDHEDFPSILGGDETLALIAVDANGLDELRGREVFTEIKQAQPETPVMWICPPGVLAPNHRTELPDAIVESDASSNFIILRLQQLLINRFFPRIVANAMKFSARSALLQSFKTEVQVMQEYVRVDKTALAEISSVISFSGRVPLVPLWSVAVRPFLKIHAIKSYRTIALKIRMKPQHWPVKCVIRWWVNLRLFWSKTG